MREDDDAAECCPGVLPATAGDIACPFGGLWCSLGNGFTDKPLGGVVIFSLLLSLTSWPINNQSAY